MGERVTLPAGGCPCEDRRLTAETAQGFMLEIVRGQGDKRAGRRQKERQLGESTW